MDIRDLGLSTRVLNALLDWPIETVEELAALSLKDLLEFPNLGIVSAREIGDILISHGLSLAGYHPKQPIPGVRKPRRRVAKIYYWSCAILDHRHVSESNAQRCIEKTQKQGKKYNAWTDERYATLQALRDSGLTYRELGQRFNVSSGRIPQVLAKWGRIQRRRAQCQPVNPPK